MSKLVKHAENELRLLRGDVDKWEDKLDNDTLEVVKLIASQGHSGMSLAVLQARLDRLLNFEALSPLTGEDSEWDTTLSPETAINERDYYVFKDVKTGRVYNSKTHEDNITFPYNPNYGE